MKNIFNKIVIYIIIVMVLVVPCFTFAFTDTPDDGTSGTLKNPLKADSFQALITAILDLMIKLGTPILALFFVYAGFMFVTAQGDQKKLETAKEMFFWGVIGAALILGASVIMTFLNETITGITA
jgi:hypothetical protein